MLDPQTGDEQREKVASDAKSKVESQGELKHEANWGIRKMAYEIDKQGEADYRCYRFTGGKELLDDLDHSLKITDGVLRFRVFKVDADSPNIVPPDTEQIMRRDDDDRERGGRRGGGDRGSRGPRRDSGPSGDRAPAERSQAPAPAETPAPAEQPPSPPLLQRLPPNRQRPSPLPRRHPPNRQPPRTLPRRHPPPSRQPPRTLRPKPLPSRQRTSPPPRRAPPRTPESASAAPAPPRWIGSNLAVCEDLPRLSARGAGCAFGVLTLGRDKAIRRSTSKWRTSTG